MSASPATTRSASTYADNLELLEQAGAELVEFSPINDPLPDNLDGIYIGRGYPELHGAKLTDNTATREAIREFAIARGPVYAECGGLMYLANDLELEEATYPLCGILPFNTKMPARLTLAYLEVRTTGGLFGPDQITRGHLSHHSEISGEPPAARCFHLQTSRGDQTDEGYYLGNVLASYAHLHFASEPTLATAFLERCRRFRASANRLVEVRPVTSRSMSLALDPTDARAGERTSPG